MYKSLFTYLLLIVSFTVLGQCPTGPTIFTTQNQIDAFAIDFPDCTILQSNNTISGSNITDLTPLSQLIGFSGSLKIENNTNLATLAGLENVTLIEGTLIIEDNFMLNSITALQNTQVDAGVLLESNFSLQSLDGLQGVVNTFGAVSIVDNPELEDLNGLNNLVSSLHLYIEENDGLLSLSGLESYETAENEIKILGNDLLTSLEGLDSLLSALSIQIAVNEILSQCSIDSICAGIDANSFNISVANNAAGCNSIAEVIENCADSFNNISGFVSYDIDNDGCDALDAAVSGVTISITDGAETLATVTDSSGFYNISVGSGSWTLSLVQESLPSYYTIQNNDFTFTYSGIGNTDVQDFCLDDTQEVNDAKITTTAINPPRPGFESNYIIYLQNLGTTILSGDFTFTFDNERLDFIASQESPSTTTENSLTFSYENLEPFEARPFTIDFTSLVPPTNNDGDLLNSQTDITTTIADDTPNNNSYSLEEIFVNSYDPNDKFAFQGTEITPDQVGDYIDYRIRFQNTGSADAINVEITDVLSDHLDWETLRILDASHEYQVIITQNNLLKFIFEDINLPPQELDEEGSNGYVIFQIRSNTDLELGDAIENTANIFFDFNEAIITNTMIITVAENLSIESVNEQTLSVFPNPATRVLNIVAKNKNIQEVAIFSLLGRKVSNTSGEYFNGTIDISTLQKGIYFLKIYVDNEIETYKFLKM